MQYTGNHRSKKERLLFDVIYFKRVNISDLYTIDNDVNDIYNIKDN